MQLCYPELLLPSSQDLYDGPCRDRGVSLQTRTLQTYSSQNHIGWKNFFKIKFSLSLQLLHLQAPSAPSQSPLWGAHRLCHPLLEGSVCCSQPACRAEVLLCTSACSIWLEGMWFRMPAVLPTIIIRFVSPWCNPPDNAETSLGACRGRETTLLERAVFHSWIHGRVPTKTQCSVVKYTYTETCSHSLWKRCISGSSLKQNICRQSWWDPIPEEHLQGQACVLQRLQDERHSKAGQPVNTIICLFTQKLPSVPCRALRPELHWGLCVLVWAGSMAQGAPDLVERQLLWLISWKQNELYIFKAKLYFKN